MFAPPYFGYLILKTDVEEEAKVAHMYTDEELAGHIIKKASAWSIPLSEENLLIEREAEDITISVHYRKELDFFNQYSKTLVYDIKVHKPLRDASGSMR